MNWLDLVLLVIVALSVLSGFFKGFAKVGIGLAATVLGVMSGLWFYGTVGAFFRPYFQSRNAANLLGFLVILAGFLIAGAIVGWMVAKFLKWVGLSWLDRLAGGVFGAVRGVVIGVAIILAILAFSPKKPPHAIVESRYAPYFVDAARAISVMAPRELKDGVAESYEKVKRIWRDAMEKGIHRLPAEKL